MTEKQCEICGAEISGAPQRIVIDGSALDVCKSCARFGKPEDKWSPVPRKMVPAERAFSIKKPKPRDHFKDLVEIVPDFGRKIKESRESQDLSLEELAVRIKEKATLLRKIEREEISPEDDIRKKLERELKITLTDQASEARVKSGLSGRGLTLGDIASIKRKTER
ncbi:MAG TPA: multiprotein bridging factor aMBF1 [Methanothrix sp.]|nr:TIGR00270 family protein [Methanothrix sp.]HOU70373.1 multiprotein bridging factor aMBF1 [Methanothrix sp.]HQE96890.1 multiprotein bridging factor aMBF1 [Methanothrix sp.]HQJ79565.1 multiprotein bridging factor aMBF1 [Methanothrix sp.]HUM80346.1 multiprotein bridging factor aMBF1 [Methanothrix sp.]